MILLRYLIIIFQRFKEKLLFILWLVIFLFSRGKDNKFQTKLSCLNFFISTTNLNSKWAESSDSVRNELNKGWKVARPSTTFNLINRLADFFFYQNFSKIWSRQVNFESLKNDLKFDNWLPEEPESLGNNGHWQTKSSFQMNLIPFLSLGLRW